jgi:hypothetical protein
LLFTSISKSTGKRYLIVRCESVGDYKEFHAAEIVSEGVDTEGFSIDVLDFEDTPARLPGIAVIVAFLAHTNCSIKHLSSQW